MALFGGIDFAPDVNSLKDAKTWGKLLMEAVGSALWILVGTKMAQGAWGWGLSFVVISIAFPGFSFNTLSNWSRFLKGEENWFTYLLTWFAHCLGSIAANSVSKILSLDDTNFATSLSFRACKAVAVAGTDTVTAHSVTVCEGAFSATFWEYFFGKEMIALFLFTCFVARAKGNDVPASLWTVLLIAVAFWLGGDGFAFFPARAFDNWAAFGSQGAWATWICQMWAVLLANIFLQWVWTE
jgi:hypothetical protein